MEIHLLVGAQMMEWFLVDHLDVNRLLAEWRWLCPQRMTLVARTAFGDLFLTDESGAVFWLNASVGKLTQIASSATEFRKSVEANENRAEWFAEQDAQLCKERGLIPTLSQCIAFSIPIVFAESGSRNKPYVADLYEYVSFLGDLHRQISNAPDGTRIELKIKPAPKS